MKDLPPLPAELTDPLPMIPAWVGQLKFWLTALLLAALVYYIYRRFFRKDEAEPSFSREAKTQRAKGIQGKISAIRKEFMANEDFREGCNRLSSEIKTHLEKQSGLEVEEMTVREIRRSFKSQKPGKFFAELQVHQFGLREPTEDDFQSACDRAKNLARNSYAISKQARKKKKMRGQHV